MKVESLLCSGTGLGKKFSSLSLCFAPATCFCFLGFDSCPWSGVFYSGLIWLICAGGGKEGIDDINLHCTIYIV